MLEIGKIYRQNTDLNSYDQPIVDDLPNYYYETYVKGFKSFKFQRGIHKVHDVVGPDGNKRCPLVIISSSPHKAGSDDTPWQDKYEPDRGYVRYYGDNKVSGERAELRGNGELLKLLATYENGDQEVRIRDAVPIVFFERAVVDGRLKGNLRFHGYGVLERAELVTQYDTKKKMYFSNYLFHFCVFSLKEENEKFDWNWIAKRCDSSLTAEETNKFAPKEWQRWVEKGKDSLHLVRRSISMFDVVDREYQIPIKGQKAYNRLQDIYHYYDKKKHDFEFLAMEVTKKVIEENGISCKPGWITKKSGDGGIDYVLRIDVGKEALAGVKVVVLGQAKCTDPEKATDGKDVARTVARLKRGWIGAYVTTSFFSKPMQQELNEDKYPILLINGKKVVEVVEEALFSSGQELTPYLDSLEHQYKIERRMAEDILYM